MSPQPAHLSKKQSAARPPVSVVLAAWRGEAYIALQLESILLQLQSGDELLVGCDSTSDEDRTWEIVQKAAEQYPAVNVRMIEGPQKGVIANFERLLEQVKSPIVFLCDQDDVWLPQKVERVLEEFEQPEVMAVVHDAKIVDENLGELAPSYQTEHGSKNGYLANIIRNSMIGCCMALRKEVIDVSLPFEKVPMHDQYLGLLALRMGEVRFIDDVLLLYRRHGANQTSLSRSSLPRQIAWRLQIVRAMAKKSGAIRRCRRKQGI